MVGVTGLSAIRLRWRVRLVRTGLAPMTSLKRKRRLFCLSSQHGWHAKGNRSRQGSLMGARFGSPPFCESEESAKMFHRPGGLVDGPALDREDDVARGLAADGDHPRRVDHPI